MKKLFLSAIIFQLVIIVSHAQIPNAGFENWTGGTPDDWLTGNSGPTVFVTQVNTAHQGSSAAKNEVLTIFNVSFTVPMALGGDGYGVPISSAPQAIHGWYIFNSVSGDYFWGLAGVLDNTGNDAGAGTTGKLAGTTVYKEFVMNMYYNTGAPNGDSLIMAFQMYNDSTNSVHEGTYFIIDDLSYGLPSGIDDESSQAIGLEPICPNPASGEVQIIYNIHSSGNTTLNIYDATGRLVRTLVDEVQAPGRYKAIADIADLPPGTYLCKLSSTEGTDAQKLIVQH